MPGKPRSFQQSTPTPLRMAEGSPQFTNAQYLALGAFIASLAAVGHGTYLNAVHGGRALRLKIYADGDQYEDTITPSDDIAYLLGGYAAQFKCVSEYQAVLGAAHRAAAERPQDAPEAVEGTQGTGGGRSKSLRGS